MACSEPITSARPSSRPPMIHDRPPARAQHLIDPVGDGPPVLGPGVAVGGPPTPSGRPRPAGGPGRWNPGRRRRRRDGRQGSRQAFRTNRAARIMASPAKRDQSTPATGHRARQRRTAAHRRRAPRNRAPSPTAVSTPFRPDHMGDQHRADEQRQGFIQIGLGPLQASGQRTSSPPASVSRGPAFHFEPNSTVRAPAGRKTCTSARISVSGQIGQLGGHGLFLQPVILGLAPRIQKHRRQKLETSCRTPGVWILATRACPRAGRAGTTRGARMTKTTLADNSAPRG